MKTRNKLVIRADGTASLRTAAGVLDTAKLYPGYSIRVNTMRLCKGGAVYQHPREEDALIYSTPQQLAKDCDAVLVKSELDF